MTKDKRKYQKKFENLTDEEKKVFMEYVDKIRNPDFYEQQIKEKIENVDMSQLKKLQEELRFIELNAYTLAYFVQEYVKCLKNIIATQSNQNPSSTPE